MFYKGFFIHAPTDAHAHLVQDLRACGRIREFKSLHAAKCFITRYLVRTTA